MNAIAGLLTGEPAEAIRDAAALADDVRAHRVHALVVDRWAGRDDAPAGVRELCDELADDAREAALFDALLMRELARVTQALHDNHVTPLVFKGSALGPTVYGASHLRPRRDHDVLVEPADTERARGVLTTLGYEAPNQIPGDLANNAWAFVREDERGVLHVLDLHWRFNNGPSVAPALTPAALKERGVACEALPGALIPCDVDALLLAAVHAYTHHANQFHPLIWLVDMDLLARRLDDDGWRELFARARTNEVQSVVARALRDTHEQLGTPLPAFVHDELARAAPDDTARVYGRGHPGVVMMRELAGLPSWGERARMMRQLAFPAPEYVLREYGVADDRMLPRLYVHRLLRAAARYALPARRRRRRQQR